jgi:hypothetical protein
MELLRTRLLTTGVVLITGFFSLHLQADTSPSPALKTPAAPTLSETDPFIKKDAPAPIVETGPLYNVIFTVETYNLSQSDGAKLIQENATDEARYDHLVALEKEGKAHLDMVMSGAQSPGGSSMIEQILVFKSAIAWDIIYGKSKVTDYKTRQTGYRLTFKADPVSDQKTGKLSLFFEHTRFSGFVDQHVNKGGGDAVVSRPQFITSRLNLGHAYLPFGKMQFLGTLSFEASEPQPEDREMTLAFGKMDLIPVTPGPPTMSKTAILEHQISLYSMDREQAMHVLNQEQKMDSAYQAVQSLVKTNQAKLERLTVCRTNGEKTRLDEVREFPYPISFNDTEAVTQDTGLTIEITAKFIANTSLVTLDLDTRWPRLLGELKGETITPASGGPLPIFEVPGVTTHLHSALGEHELMGTFSPSANTGLTIPQATNRVWLEFIRTSAVNP